MAFQPPRHPEFFDPALAGARLPEPIAREAERPRSDRPADLARVAALFWERDLQPWEKRSALAIAAFGGPALAADFISSGWRQFGHFPEAAALREAHRLIHLNSYLTSARQQPIHLAQPSKNQRLSAPQKAALGLGSLACLALSPCALDPARARLISLGIAAGILALPFAGPALWSLFGAPLGVSLATAPVFLGASLWSSYGIGASMDGTSDGLARMSSTPLMLQARLSGALGRLKRAQAPGPERLSLPALARLSLHEPFPFERLSPSAQARISPEQFELSKDFKAFGATQAISEAQELEDFARPAPAPAPPTGAFSRSVRALARFLTQPESNAAPTPSEPSEANAPRVKKRAPRL